MQQYEIMSPIGRLYLVASEEAVHGLHFRPSSHPRTQTPNRMHKKMESQLQEYFSGLRQEFDLPLKFCGTPFQNKVWRELAKIPFGQTISYTTLAQRAEYPKAVRAAGSANGRNPIAIIIPCHRVIAADGGLGGFAGGLEAKSSLLELEGACPPRLELQNQTGKDQD